MKKMIIYILFYVLIVEILCIIDCSLSGRIIEFYCFIGVFGFLIIVIVVFIICIFLKR